MSQLEPSWSENCDCFNLDLAIYHLLIKGGREEVINNNDLCVTWKKFVNNQHLLFQLYSGYMKEICSTYYIQ